MSRVSKSESHPCRTCGTPVPPDAPFGHCPACLVEHGFGPLPDEAAPLSTRPSQVGEYELLEPLGRGGMGVVYKARQVSLKRLVALKMLGPHASAFPGIAQRLRAEAEAAGSLRHPQIVTIYDVGEHEGHPFFTMELIEGAGLDKFIGPDGFHGPTEGAGTGALRGGPEAGIARIMIQIARAVDHAHKHGVLHRDLKPANILLDAKGEPHLTDFGLAKVLGRAASTGTASGAILGTPAYMAPEQASGGTKHSSTAADTYSLGAILYEMLTGRPPFRAETPLETLRRVVEDQPKPPSTFNRNLDSDLPIICLKCLEKDPGHRYGSALALAEDLERWLRREPIEARTARRAERLWRWCRREPVLAGMLGSLILLLAAVAILGLSLYQHEKNDREIEEGIRGRRLTDLLNRLNPDGEPVRISPQDFALLGGHSLTEDGTETLVTLGFISRLRKTDEALQSIAPLLIHLQTNQARTVSPRLLFELHIFKERTNAIKALLREELDILRVDPADYISIRRQNTNIQLLAKQVYAGQPGLRGAIFTRAGLAITNLQGLKGASLTFGERGTALGEYLAKARFVRFGLRASDFRALTNSRSVDAIAAVRTNAFDLGVSELDHLINAEKLRLQYKHLRGQFATRLTILEKLDCPNDPWLATGRLDPRAAAVLKNALLSLGDYAAPLPFDPKLSRFEPAQPSDYDALAREMEQSKLFDQSD